MLKQKFISKKNIKTLNRIKLLKNNTSDDLILIKIINTINNYHNIKLFDTQILAALSIIDGNIIDMKTGEGKTYSGILASCYLALTGKKVHMVSANIYLTERDYTKNIDVYKELGLSAALLLPTTDYETKKKMYTSDILFTTASQLGFDYLKDIHAFEENQKLNIPLDFAIIDEADSVLLDQSSMPLINSKPIEQDLKLFLLFNDIAKSFIKDEDFSVDESSKHVVILETGFKKLEDFFLVNKAITNYKTIYSSGNTKFISLLENALRAHNSMFIDVNYISRDGQILAVDSQTHRVLPPSQRWSNGLHQAIEAKEGIQPLPELGTESSISLQNYFRLYKELSAMSGTALIDKDEFKEVYDLNLAVIPENSINKRIKSEDLFFTNLSYKNNFLIDLVIEKNKSGQPILIAATSIKESENISSLLKEHELSHRLINAKNPEEESIIIEQAGEKHAITVATNMAGRGADIILGGANSEPSLRDDVNQLGGLFVIGYGRSDLRRIDEQLSGRCARQGDQGEVQFLLCLDDSLADSLPKRQIKNLFSLLGLSESEGVYNSKISHSFYTIQNRKEQQDLENRKQMLMYDDILQKQRNIYYSFRDRVYGDSDLDAFCVNVVNNWVDIFIEDFLYKTQHLDELQVLTSLKNNMKNVFEIEIPFEKVPFNDINKVMKDALLSKFKWLKSKADESVLDFNFFNYMKSSLLFNLDGLWSEYFQSIEVLRNNVSIRSTAQKNPFEEFSNESFLMFEKFTNEIPFQFLMILLSSNHIRNFTPIKTEEGETIE